MTHYPDLKDLLAEWRRLWDQVQHQLEAIQQALETVDKHLQNLVSSLVATYPKQRQEIQHAASQHRWYLDAMRERARWISSGESLTFAARRIELISNALAPVLSRLGGQSAKPELPEWARVRYLEELRRTNKMMNALVEELTSYMEHCSATEASLGRLRQIVDGIPQGYIIQLLELSMEAPSSAIPRMNHIMDGKNVASELAEIHAATFRARAMLARRLAVRQTTIQDSRRILKSVDRTLDRIDKTDSAGNELWAAVETCHVRIDKAMSKLLGRSWRATRKLLKKSPPFRPKEEDERKSAPDGKEF